MPELHMMLLLFFAGVLAGVCNAIAGGGTFFTFPVFLSAGIPPVVANASNAVAVWPGHALAAIGYRKELREIKHGIKGSLAIAMVGGAVGALLLAYIGNRSFSMLIPFLILFATLLFMYGKAVNSWIDSRTASISIESPGYLTRVSEFAVAVYGGFFGAGLGIMLMGGLLMLGVHDIHANNALKNLLGALITAVSVIVLTVSGLVSWPHTIFAFVGAVVGGFLGVPLARLLSDIWLKRLVILIGIFLTIYYFIKYYF
jgi:uncharacterized membrane protein YfcA